LATEPCYPGRTNRFSGRFVGKSATVLGCGALLAVATLAGCSGGSGVPSAGASAASSAAASSSPVANASTSAGVTATAATAGSSGSGASGTPAIPTPAWITPPAIPLYAAYHWPSPSSAAKSAKSPELSAVQDCQLSLSIADRAELGAFPAARADLSPTTGASGGQDDWAAQETILATGDTTSGDTQGIYDLYTDLVADLDTCVKTASGAKVSVAVNQGAEYAATITVPTSTGSTLTWHEYLAAPYGYLVELSVYVAPYSGDRPSASWDGSSPAAVLGALQSGPCSITKLC
jgi:hypothetical protein